MRFLTASNIAQQLGCRPRDISDAFYSRELDASRCPIVKGVRLIPSDYVPAIQAVLERKGKIQRQEAAGATA